MPLSSRTSMPEIMDGDRFTPGELAGNLADLERYNRIAGGTASVRRALQGLVRGRAIERPLTLLEIGAGSVGMARAIARCLPRELGHDLPETATNGSSHRGRGRENAGRDRPARRGKRSQGPLAAGGDLHSRIPEHARTGSGPESRSRRSRGSLVVGGDLHPRMLEHARKSGGGNGGVRLCAADARALPHADRSFHLAWSSLLIHHLDDGSIVAALAEMKRVTRVGFVASDLRRSPLALASVWALTRVTTRNRLTLHDGPLSVRRALTVGELEGHALEAGLEPMSSAEAGGFRVGRSGPARLILVYRHPAPGNGSGPGEAAA